MTLHAIAVDAGADHHDIINYGEAAFASDPVSLTVPESAIRENRSLIEPYATTMLGLGNGKFLGMEEIPN